jgi:triosephosphate isomerase
LAAIVRRKVQVAQENGLKPILCVGEDADQLDEASGRSS